MSSSQNNQLDHEDIPEQIEEVEHKPQQKKHSSKRRKLRKAKKTYDDEEMQNKIRKMFKNAQNIIKSSQNDFWPSLSKTPLGTARRNYCNEVLKCLLFGYQQLKQYVQQMRKSKQQWLVCPQTLYFLQNYSTLQQSTPALIEVVTQVQSDMYEFYGTKFSFQEMQSRKYRFQMTHLIRNLKDAFNFLFRQEIITGVLPPQAIASMDEIDMLEPNKKLFITTKNKSLLYYKELIKKQRSSLKLEDQARLQQVIVYRDRDQERNREFQQFSSSVVSKISYFLSRTFYDKLESQLMQIPDKIIRKKALASLKESLND